MLDKLFIQPIFVIRGTKAHPDENLESAWKEYKAAQVRYEQAQELFLTESRMLKLREETENVESTSAQDDAIKQNLFEIIAKLQERVDLLEKVKSDRVAETSTKFQKLTTISQQLACGGIAGAVARTSVAPIDRVKILMQTQYIQLKGEKKYTSITQTLRTILQEEGVKKLWRGNLTNMVRVVPYSATQFATYDFFKAFLSSDSVPIDINPTVHRLMSGAFAGMTATTVTHPLDCIRLRLSVERELKNAFDASRSIYKEGGMRAFYKGYVPTLLSLSPFIAINFATFDFLKKKANPNGDKPISTWTTLVLGGCAGMFAQTMCFPLDTVRRRMQLKGTAYPSTADAFYTIFKVEGVRGFYQGMAANAVKIIPNNAIRFVVYDTLKQHIKKE